MVGCLDLKSFWKSDIDVLYTVINHSNIIQMSYLWKDVKRVICAKYVENQQEWISRNQHIRTSAYQDILDSLFHITWFPSKTPLKPKQASQTDQFPPPSSVGSRTVSSFFVLHFVELFQGNEPWIGVQIWNMSSMFTNMIWKKPSRCQQSKMAINMRCVWSSRTITKENGHM